MASILDSEVEDLGGGKSINDVLLDFGNEIQDALRASLDSKNANDTLALRQSIQFRVKFLGQFFQFELSMADHGDFIDQGVEGVGGIKADGSAWSKHSFKSPFKYKVKPSPEHFSDWSYRKRLNPFAVSQSIFHKGLKPNHFYSDVVTEARIKKLEEDLAEAGARELTISIQNAFGQNQLGGIGR